MNLDLIEQAISTATPEAIEALLNDQDTVFFVDWREEDDAIVEYCENILKTGDLSAELASTDDENGFKIYIHRGGRRGRIPLTYSAEDRHITILALNVMLKPDYEVRYCIDGHGSDTGTFLPLPSATWSDLERKFGDRVAKRFYQIKQKPNLFTDRIDF